MAAKSANHVVVWMNFLKDAINEGDATIIGIVVAIAVVILTILIVSVLKRRGNARRGVLVLGCCDSGKTLLFTQLVYKKYMQSCTSMKANEGTYTIPGSNKSLRIFDLPGHDRGRMQTLDAYKDNARGVVFVIDSATIQKDIKDIAEYLYTVLSDSKISNLCPPVLIACNKQDLTFAKGAKVIQGQLEKEMNTLRVTRSAALKDLSAGNNNTFLGKRNKDFTFADLKPMRIEFAECSAQGKEAESEAELNEVEVWLSKVA